MRILIVCPVFPPEPVTSATTSAHLAEALAERGHEVTVITSAPSRPGGKVHPGYRRGFWRRERCGSGYEIVRTWSVLPAKASASRRLLENLTFGFCAMLHVSGRRCDVVYQNNWPIFAGGMVALAARLRGAPLVSSVQDIHPEAALHAGKIASGPGIRFLQALDGFVARRAAALVVISERFAEFYRTQRRVPPERVYVVPNWMDETDIAPGDRLGPFRASLGLEPSTFAGMYAGNIGEVADVECLVETASLLRGDEWFALAIVGDGARRGACEARAVRLGLTNIRFYHPWLSERATDVHAAADVLLLPMRGSSGTTSIPSKLIAYMLSGRPVVAAVDGASDIARVVEDSGCGVVVPPGDAQALAAALRRLHSDPEELIRRGELARRYAEHHFGRQAGSARLASVVEAAGMRPAPGPAAEPGITQEDGSSAAPRDACGDAADGIVVVPLRAEHSAAVARLHMQNLSSVFAGIGGARVLAAYYRAIGLERGGGGFVAQAGDRVVGYVCGVWDVGLLRRSVVAGCSLGDLAALGAWLASHPLCAWRAHGARPRGSCACPSYELRPLVVAADMRGRGIATSLVRRLLEDATQRRAARVHLYVDSGNKAAQAFYKASGFSEAGMLLIAGRPYVRCELAVGSCALVATGDAPEEPGR